MLIHVSSWCNVFHGPEGKYEFDANLTDLCVSSTYGWQYSSVRRCVCVCVCVATAAAGSEVQSVLRGAGGVGMCSHRLALFVKGVIFTDVWQSAEQIL